MGIVGEGLKKLVAICCTATCPIDVQCVHAAAKGDSLCGEFEDLISVLRCSVRSNVCELEELEVVCLEDELPQRPLL